MSVSLEVHLEAGGGDVGVPANVSLQAALDRAAARTQKGYRHDGASHALHSSTPGAVLTNHRSLSNVEA
jgi:hypothetical protein